MDSLNLVSLIINICSRLGGGGECETSVCVMGGERGGCEVPQGGFDENVCVCTSTQEPSLITVKAILILDNDGKRIICKVRWMVG